MSSSLFDTAVSHLFHMPEALEKLVGGSMHDAGQRHQNHHVGTGGGENEEKGYGGATVDIFEGPKEYVFYVDVPGLSKADIQVMLEDEKVLVIKSNGKRKRDEVEDEDCKYIRLERRAAVKFLRKFRLPEDANPTAISAKCENGELAITVEKSPPPESKTKTVQVEVA